MFLTNANQGKGTLQKASFSNLKHFGGLLIKNKGCIWHEGTGQISISGDLNGNCLAPIFPATWMWLTRHHAEREQKDYDQVPPQHKL